MYNLRSLKHNDSRSTSLPRSTQRRAQKSKKRITSDDEDDAVFDNNEYAPTPASRMRLSSRVGVSSSLGSLNVQQQNSPNTIFNEPNPYYDKQFRQTEIVDKTTSAINLTIINELINDSNSNIFDRQKITVDGKEVFRSVIYRFFESQTNFTTKPNKAEEKKNKIKHNFKCIICNKICRIYFGEPCNLQKHLESHAILETFFANFKNYNKKKEDTSNYISDDMLNLIQFFLSSNSSVNVLENIYLRRLVSINMPGRYYFKQTILPTVTQKLKISIQEKLQSASYVSLISDIWTNKQMHDFLAVSASLIDKYYRKEMVLLGIVRLGKEHTAETIQKAIQDIINGYDFDKKKVSSIVTDEGSNYVRLFKVESECLYIDDTDDNANSDQENQYLSVDDQNEDNAIEINQNSINLQNEESNVTSKNAENADVDSPVKPVNISIVNAEIEEETTILNDLRFTFNIQRSAKNENDSVYSSQNIVSNGADEIETAESSICDNLSNTLILDNEVENVDTSQNTNLLDNQEYEDETVIPGILQNLKLSVGENVISRYPCAAHKLNLSIRKAIKDHEHIKELLKTLSKYARKVKISVNLSRPFGEKRAKLKCENLTRWSSSFHMLTSFINARNKGIDFSGLDVSFQDIEIYHQILFPLYRCNLVFQSTDSSIAQTVPIVLHTIYDNLKAFKLDPGSNYDEFRNLLLNYMNKKFKHEMTSNIYAVSALLNTEKLSLWYNRSYAKSTVKRAFDSMYEVAKLFYSKNTTIEQNKNPEASNSNLNSINNIPSKKNFDFFSHFITRNRLESVDGEKMEEIIEFEAKIYEEKTFFIKTLKESSDWQNTTSAVFWRQHEKNMPCLANLARRLLNINSSSSAIERFFSLCGIICKKHCTNMSDDLFIKRSMLTANFHMLESLNSLT